MRIRNIFILGGCSALVCISCTTQNSQSMQQQNDEILSQTISNELRKGISIYFDSNSALIRPEDTKVLFTASNLLKLNPKLYLVLEGHTDSSGNEMVNQRVSFARANAVKYELTKIYNVNPDQLITKAEGASHPIDTNETEVGRAKNRRVTMILKIH